MITRTELEGIIGNDRTNMLFNSIMYADVVVVGVEDEAIVMKNKFGYRKFPVTDMGGNSIELTEVNVDTLDNYDITDHNSMMDLIRDFSGRRIFIRLK